MTKKKLSEECVSPLCQKCADDNEPKKCQHTTNRLIHTTITFPTLSHCIKRGYKLIKEYECIGMISHKKSLITIFGHNFTK